MDYLTANDMRAAHLYHIVFARAKRNFAIAGLKSQIDVKMTFSSSYSKSNYINIVFVSIQGTLQFEGVYFQNVMKQIEGMDGVERDEFFAPIHKYRIYIEK